MCARVLAHMLLRGCVCSRISVSSRISAYALTRYGAYARNTLEHKSLLSKCVPQHAKLSYIDLSFPNAPLPPKKRVQLSSMHTIHLCCPLYATNHYVYYVGYHQIYYLGYTTRYLN